MLDKIGPAPTFERPDVTAIAYFLDGPRAGQQDKIPAIARGAKELPAVDEYLTVQSDIGPIRYRRHYLTQREDKSYFVAYIYQPLVA